MDASCEGKRCKRTHTAIEVVRAGRSYLEHTLAWVAEHLIHVRIAVDVEAGALPMPHHALLEFLPHIHTANTITHPAAAAAAAADAD